MWEHEGRELFGPPLPGRWLGRRVRPELLETVRFRFVILHAGRLRPLACEGGVGAPLVDEPETVKPKTLEPDPDRVSWDTGRVLELAGELRIAQVTDVRRPSRFLPEQLDDDLQKARCKVGGSRLVGGELRSRRV